MGPLIAEANISTPYLRICDLFHDGVGRDILQRQTLRWLVHVAGRSEIYFDILSHHLIGETVEKSRKLTV